MAVFATITVARAANAKTTINTPVMLSFLSGLQFVRQLGPRELNRLLLPLGSVDRCAGVVRLRSGRSTLSPRVLLSRPRQGEDLRGGLRPHPPRNQCS